MVLDQKCIQQQKITLNDNYILTAILSFTDWNFAPLKFAGALSWCSKISQCPIILSWDDCTLLLKWVTQDYSFVYPKQYYLCLLLRCCLLLVGSLCFEWISFLWIELMNPGVILSKYPLNEILLVSSGQKEKISTMGKLIFENAFSIYRGESLIRSRCSLKVDNIEPCEIITPMAEESILSLRSFNTDFWTVITVSIFFDEYCRRSIST